MARLLSENQRKSGYGVPMPSQGSMAPAGHAFVQLPRPPHRRGGILVFAPSLRGL